MKTVRPIGGRDPSRRRTFSPVADAAWGHYVLVFVLAVLAGAAYVAYLFHSLRIETTESWKSRLSGLADEKAQLVAVWLKERKADAEVVAGFPTVVKILASRPGARRAHAEASHLSSILDHVAAAYGYRDIQVVNRQGETVARTARGAPLDAENQELARQVMEGNRWRIEMTPGGLASVGVPVSDAARVTAGALPPKPLGAVVLRMDPDSSLYPLLLPRWEVTETGETLLARRVGNEVEFFSPRRHGPEGDLPVQFPWNSGTAAVPAVEGRQVEGEFRDYRGVAVLAATRHIAATGWGLVQKVDLEEVMAEFRAKAVREGALTLLLLLALAGLLAARRRHTLAGAWKSEQERFRALLEAQLHPIVASDREARIVFLNRRARQLFGFRDEDMLGQPFEGLFPERLRDELRRRHELCLGDDAAASPDTPAEAEVLSAEGGEVPVEISLSRLDTSAGPLVYAALRDLRPRLLTERALHESSEMLRAIIEASPVAVNVIAPDGTVKLWNSAAEQTFGWQAEEVVGRPLPFIPEEKKAEFETILRRTLDANGVKGIEVWRRRKDGSPVLVNLSVAPLRDAQGRHTGFVGVLEDITERKRLEEEHRRLASAVENTAECVVITELDGTIVYVNPSFERVTGYTRAEAVGKNPRFLKSGRQDDAYYRHLWQTIEAGEVWAGCFINRTKDGSLVETEAVISPVRDAAGRPAYYVAVERDVTRERALQEQLRQVQKMEALGRLAGGVAHDFNNLLTAITGYSELLQAILPPQGRARDYLDEIRKAGGRAAALTQQLLAFSRRQPVEAHVLDLNAAIRDMHKMLRRLIGEDVELVLDLASDLGPVKADPGQIDQVLLNLTVNARDAMPRGGRVTISTANVELTETYTTQHATLAPGSYVALSVSDTGCGIDPEILPHIFEPFFTTKDRGKGTGLGLATVYGIVRQSGGSVSVSSQKGEGTVFRVYLPRVGVATDAERLAGHRPAARPASETILVVEDDDAVRNLVRMVLESRGYRVLEARGGVEALDRAREHGGPLHLLLTDIVMPEMSGHELAEHARALHPRLRVLYISGYADQEQARRGVRDPLAGYLPKPFSPETLERKVREVLDAVPADRA